MNYNWTIFWNGRPYHSGQVSLDFIVWLAKNEKFTLMLEGHEFKGVTLDMDGPWYRAGFGDKESGTIECAHSRYSRKEALTYLIENLSESILSKVKVA